MGERPDESSRAGSSGESTGAEAYRRARAWIDTAPGKAMTAAFSICGAGVAAWLSATKFAAFPDERTYQVVVAVAAGLVGLLLPALPIFLVFLVITALRRSVLRHELRGMNARPEVRSAHILREKCQVAPGLSMSGTRFFQAMRRGFPFGFDLMDAYKLIQAAAQGRSSKPQAEAADCLVRLLGRAEVVESIETPSDPVMMGGRPVFRPPPMVSYRWKQRAEAVEAVLNAGLPIRPPDPGT